MIMYNHLDDQIYRWGLPELVLHHICVIEPTRFEFRLAQHFGSRYCPADVNLSCA